MARSTDPTIKTRLLDKCLDTLIEKGLSEFSLRKMAEQVGTSARMLIYHFGSAEALFAEIIIAYSRREKSRFKAALYSQQELSTMEAFIKFSWASYMAKQRINVLRAFVEIYGQCLRDRKRYASFFQEILYDWIELVKVILEQRCGLSTPDSGIWATLIVATCRGLLLDWLASDETHRIEDTLALFQGLAGIYYLRRQEEP